MKSDSQLQHDVVAELDWDRNVNAAHVGVTAHEGVVTLTGHVPVYSEKVAAAAAAKRVHGVRAVANEIEVRPNEAHVRDDERLAAAAVHALEWDAEAPGDRLQVAVESGWVTVEGVVDEPYQRAAVDRALRHLSGVRGVVNSVQVAPRELIDACQQAIESAFLRSATLDSKLLKVEMEGAEVILTGEVHSHAELDEALRIAASAPGVRDVRNCLTVTPWGVGPAEEWGY